MTKRLPEEGPCVRTSTRCLGEGPKKTLTVRKQEENDVSTVQPFITRLRTTMKVNTG